MVKIASSLINLSESIPEIWETLNDAERETIILNTKILEFKKNELIYKLNETPHNLYCLVRGKVKIYRNGIGGRTQIVRMIKLKQYFGYRAFFAKQHYITEAAAFENCIVCSIPLKIIETMIQNNAKLGFFFIKDLSVDLGIADERVVNLTQKHLRGRLAESLVFLIENYGFEEDGATIDIYLSREDLASLSNMTASNAIRTLAVFVEEKIIALDGRRIKIRDQETLTRISKIG